LTWGAALFCRGYLVAMLVFGRYSITVESQGGRQWFRLRLGRSVLADHVASMAELERELARHGLTLGQFTEAGNDE